jgi:glycosyltransferase involved in cell wall biosynthesis
MPAYREEKVISSLVMGLLQQADDALSEYPGLHLELIIASDDANDYSKLLPNDRRIHYCEPGFKTGPAIARTRALHRATGRFAIAIDADDTVCESFIRSVYAATHVYDAFAVRAHYVKAGQRVRSLEVDTLTLDNFIAYSGSAPVVFPRHWMTAYPDVVAEDAVSVVSVMNLAGGSLPVIEAQYNITTHPESFCARLGSQFSRLYAEHLADVENIAEVVGNPAIEGMLALLYQARLEVNTAYEACLSSGRDIDYHEFVVEMLTDGYRGADTIMGKRWRPENVRRLISVGAQSA